MPSENDSAYAQKKVAFWLERKAFLEKHYGPKYPCMVLISIMPTDGALTESTDHLVKTFYLPDVFRRMVLIVHKYVLHLYRKHRIEDSTLNRA